jgi:hypothetical protein
MVEKARSGFGRADLWVSQLGDGVVGRVEMLGERYVRCGYEGYECGNYRQSYKLYVLDLYWKCGSGGVQTLTIVAELWLVEANNGLSLSLSCVIAVLWRFVSPLHLQLPNVLSSYRRARQTFNVIYIRSSTLKDLSWTLGVLKQAHAPEAQMLIRYIA